MKAVDGNAPRRIGRRGAGKERSAYVRRRKAGISSASPPLAPCGVVGRCREQAVRAGPLRWTHHRRRHRRSRIPTVFTITLGPPPATGDGVHGVDRLVAGGGRRFPPSGAPGDPVVSGTGGPVGRFGRISLFRIGGIGRPALGGFAAGVRFGLAPSRPPAVHRTARRPEGSASTGEVSCAESGLGRTGRGLRHRLTGRCALGLGRRRRIAVVDVACVESGEAGRRPGQRSRASLPSGRPEALRLRPRRRSPLLWRALPSCPCGGCGPTRCPGSRGRP